MEQKITKEELFRESDALNAYITDALSIYSVLMDLSMPQEKKKITLK